MNVILSVDDNAVNLATIRMILHKDYDLRIAKTGQGALNLLKNISVDLILLDIAMPDIDGFELYRRIRMIPAYDRTPIVFVTSHGSAEFLTQAIAIGASDYIVKPFSREILLGKVRKILGTGGSLRPEKSILDEMEITEEEGTKEYLLQKLIILSNACMTGNCSLVETLIKQLERGNYGHKINQSLTQMAKHLITFDYAMIQAGIDDLFKKID